MRFRSLFISILLAGIGITCSKPTETETEIGLDRQAKRGHDDDRSDGDDSSYDSSDYDASGDSAALLEYCGSAQASIVERASVINKGCESGDAVLVVGKLEEVLDKFEGLSGECSKGAAIKEYEAEKFSAAFLKVVLELQIIIVKIKSYPVVAQKSQSTLSTFGKSISIVLKYLSSYHLDIHGWASSGGIDIALFQGIGVTFLVG